MNIMKFENFIYPRGWVNVKVDDDMYLRMQRYVTILDKILVVNEGGTKRDKYDLQKKVKMLSDIDRFISNENISIKDKISLITILQYLNELRHNFNESSAGFLLEGFLAALIHGKLVGGRDIADIESRKFLTDKEKEEIEKSRLKTLSLSYAELDVAEFETMPSQEDEEANTKIKYQIKLYKEGSTIKVNVGKTCDYYVICLKKIDRNIDVHILTYDQIISDNMAVKKRGGDKNDIERNIVTQQLRNGVKRYVELNTDKIKNNNDNKVTLTIVNLDEKIQKCAGELKMVIDDIYLKISDLHYNIDSLVTGVDKNNTEISSQEAEKSARETISEIEKKLGDLGQKI